ncbi:DUF2397 family protein [Streptomyces wuyuanensis]|uniref:DUF2397 family protein n=1 Tax=Streptomyces wuyuanensis TaxID=1196353 RepID=UPI00341EF165
MRALQSLLANAKRMLRSATGEMSLRTDLLRLARWFDEAAPQDAHDIAVAAFGLPRPPSGNTSGRRRGGACLHQLVGPAVRSRNHSR